MVSVSALSELPLLLGLSSSCQDRPASCFHWCSEGARGGGRCVQNAKMCVRRTSETTPSTKVRPDGRPKALNRRRRSRRPTKHTARRSKCVCFCRRHHHHHWLAYMVKLGRQTRTHSDRWLRFGAFVQSFMQLAQEGLIVADVDKPPHIVFRKSPRVGSHWGQRR